ncbi:hypothetical protein ACFFGQ_03580 [Rufibacter quisquiliarum]|uniref:Uncharacterized protein n=2 Tax=Rufibacter quisquiliarum TaxID=1549639 RepID=A0A839GTZ3_9BACT|nr:hypothetical protein [Rufibacter quisquiliarum]
MSAEKVKSLLKQILGDVPGMVIMGTVTELNHQDRTCDISPEDGGADVLDVRLRPLVDGKDTGLNLTPAKGAHVVVLMIDENDGLLISCTELETFQVKVGQHQAKLDKEGWCFNSGDNGGLVNWPSLVEELNKTNSFVQAIAEALTQFVPVFGDGGAALKTFATTKLGAHQLGSFDGLEDSKVKH